MAVVVCRGYSLFLKQQMGHCPLQDDWIFVIGKRRRKGEDYFSFIMEPVLLLIWIWIFTLNILTAPAGLLQPLMPRLLVAFFSSAQSSPPSRWKRGKIKKRKIIFLSFTDLFPFEMNLNFGLEYTNCSSWAITTTDTLSANHCLCKCPIWSTVCPGSLLPKPGNKEETKNGTLGYVILWPE